MSTALLPSRFLPSRFLPERFPPQSRPLAAERLRWRRSAAARLPLLGLAAAAVQGLLYLAGSTRHGWQALTAWQILWVTFLGPTALGLLAGLLTRRESRARGGGAWWRPVGARQAHLAQFVVLAGYAAALQTLVLLAALPFGWVDGLAVPGPVGSLVVLAGVQWGATMTLLALAHLVGRRFGLFPALGLGMSWAVAGTLTAETGSWEWQPWAWSVRAVLPLVGTHANGIPLHPGEPLLTVSPWPPTLLSVALAVAIAVLGGRVARKAPGGRLPGGTLTRRLPGGTLTRRLTGRRRTTADAGAAPATSRTPWRYGAPAALLVSLRRTGIAPLTAGAGALVVVGLLLWPDPEATLQLTALVVLPVGTALLPVLVWQSTTPAWRVLTAHAIGPRRLALTLLALMGLTVWGFAACTTAALLLAGLPAGRAVTFGALAAGTGLLLVAWQFWLVVRAGVGTALAAAAVGTLLALVVGGTGLADTLWPLVPWSWALTAGAGHRAALCVPVALLLSAALARACCAAAERAAARGGQA